MGKEPVGIYDDKSFAYKLSRRLDQQNIYNDIEKRMITDPGGKTHKAWAVLVEKEFVGEATGIANELKVEQRLGSEITSYRASSQPHESFFSWFVSSKLRVLFTVGIVILVLTLIFKPGLEDKSLNDEPATESVTTDTTSEEAVSETTHSTPSSVVVRPPKLPEGFGKLPEHMPSVSAESYLKIQKELQATLDRLKRQPVTERVKDSLVIVKRQYEEVERRLKEAEKVSNGDKNASSDNAGAPVTQEPEAAAEE